jgi:hypothetical protein
MARGRRLASLSIVALLIAACSSSPTLTGAGAPIEPAASASPKVLARKVAPPAAKPKPKPAVLSVLTFLDNWNGPRHRHDHLQSVQQEFRAGGSLLTEVWLRVEAKRILIAITDPDGELVESVEVIPNPGITRIVFPTPLRVTKGALYTLNVSDTGAAKPLLNLWFGGAVRGLGTFCETRVPGPHGCSDPASGHAHDLNMRILGKR